jgi:signal transduction histidine kinase
MGNPIYLADAIVNLLDNAIKYSSSNTEITIELTKNDSWSVLSIQDQGEGIETEDLPYIFDYFYRGDKARTNRTETGLGLAITKRIVELHHGRIEVESKAGQGSTFRIFLPLYKVFEADF